MYRVTFELDAFNGTRDASESLQDLNAMLGCLIAINTNYLQRRVGRDQGQNPAVPLLYQSGVRYEEEPIGAEFWRDIPTILKYARQGAGSDCEDLVCWQVAELRVRFGIPAEAIVIPQLVSPQGILLPQAQGPTSRLGSFLYHIQTWTPQGIDDPSARLGMPSQLAGRLVRCAPGLPNCSGILP